ncbi:hypothetical protein B0T22DRAFT_476245 [Podospora appendiculata]|uniref:BTB domain-containing protein n=1 Tax=Podospora appendiculata TaxID=314037 RepID=A0AAE0XI48_9PEZI|nr:hypothetical protein B0T22DRAFT_476245 [Podospora appendiculata]
MADYVSAEESMAMAMAGMAALANAPTSPKHTPNDDDYDEEQDQYQEQYQEQYQDQYQQPADQEKPQLKTEDQGSEWSTATFMGERATATIADDPRTPTAPAAAPATAPAAAPAMPGHKRKAAEMSTGGPENSGDIVEVLDPHGDLVLVIGAEKREFLVCSRTLARASPEFDQKCLRNWQVVPGPRKEGDTPGPLRKLNLCGFNAEAFHVVLLVIHGAAPQVHQKMHDTKLLHDVICVTHHFDMTKCLAPVAGTWLKRIYKKDVSSYDDIATQLWITHQLGHLPCAKQTVQNMILSARRTPDGKLIGRTAPENKRYDAYNTLKITGLLDDILQARNSLIKEMLRRVDETIKRLSHSPKIPSQADGKTVCRARSTQSRCDSSMLGGLFRAMHAENWKNFDHNSSPERTYKRIMRIAALASNLAEPTSAHRACDPFGGTWPTLESLVEDEVEKISWDVRGFAERAFSLGMERA